MLYLHDGHIEALGTDWVQLVDLIEEVVRIDDGGDCVHPLKPYLRFRDPANRIIAMPAFVGGSVEMAGIKWIASYPANRQRGMPRAHNTIILNHADTGEPAAFLRSGRLNGLRTAAVSGVMLRAFRSARSIAEQRLGIIGWGPVGRLHLDMCAALLGRELSRITLYDLQGIEPDTVPEHLRDRTVIVKDWREAYRDSSLIATCTVSATRYIDERPPAGALLLNVSLRDYQPEGVSHVKTIVVDDWQEVCRENTDIEQLHLRYGLQEDDVLRLADVVCRDGLVGTPAQESVFFNPMGLGIFDIAVADHYRRQAVEAGAGIVLDRG